MHGVGILLFDSIRHLLFVSASCRRILLGGLNVPSRSHKKPRRAKTQRLNKRKTKKSKRGEKIRKQREERMDDKNSNQKQKKNSWQEVIAGGGSQI